MKVQAPFGFVTGCHAGDKFMVQATLASMKHFCPETPICLVVDGSFDVSDLEREYSVIVLRVSELPSKEMRNLMSGNGRAKLAAMWEGPFEFYVWLDSDAIVWGDFRPQIRTDVDFQIFWSDIDIPADATEIPPWLPHFQFDPQKLRNFDPEFDWRGKAYFCTGAFACKRNVISFEKWMEAESWGKETPGLFGDFSEQPLLSYFVHSMSQRGEIKSAMSNLQDIWGHHGKEELIEDCGGTDWHFPTEIRRPRVAHFCGRKPFLFDRQSYSRPFTIARLEHHRRQHGGLGAWLAVLNEERHVLAGKFWRRLQRVVGKPVSR
jgi:Glycosyl transferase family 8.